MRLLAIIILTSVFTVAVFPQLSSTESQSDKEKKKKELEERVVEILNSALSDASTLKLARNRAVIFALVGDLYWKFDEKRARDLFRNCEGELITANAEDESNQKDNPDPFATVFVFSDSRSDVLPIIAKRDADLAIQFLKSTRPARLSAEMTKVADPNTKDEGGWFSFSPERFRVQQELALEQRFAVLAANQDPEKALKLFKESLAKGLSWQVMPLLDKINEKDEKKAVSLADDVVRKIVDTDLMKNREDLSVVVSILASSTSTKQPQNQKKKAFKFAEPQIREIANKLVATFLQPSKSADLLMVMLRVMPALDKAVPEKAGLVKQRAAELRKSMPPELKSLERVQKHWSPTSTPEEILADLPDLNDYEKVTAYQALEQKIAEIADESRAQKLIGQIPDEKARTQALEAYESAKINRAASAGKLDDAKQLIKNLSQKKTQIQRLVSLAIQFHRKKTETDLETALGLMKDAKQLANEFPEDESELSDLMEVVRGYAIVDPPTAFRLFEPIVEQLNDFVQASAILSKYNRSDANFRKGELLMPTKGGGWESLLLFKYERQISLLGKADLNRMNSFADKFQRNDVRTIVKLFTVRGFLADEERPEENSDEYDGNIPFGA